MTRFKKILATVAGLSMFALSGTASALTVDGAVFSTVVTGSGTSWDVTLTMNFTGSTAGSQFVGDNMEAWSLTLPGDAGPVTFVSISSGIGDWKVYDTAQADASGCGNGAVNAICADWGTKNVIDGGGPLITTADTFVFKVHVEFAASQPDFGTFASNFHLLTVAYDADKKEWVKSGGLISLPITPGTPGDDDDHDAPEPGTLALLGLGLMGLGFSRRKVAK